MGAADRTVQRLHLRAPSAQAAVHAAHRLEDALRCASLPDAGERVLLVRRLHLGRLPEGLSSQSLSLLIEQRVAALGCEWVHGGEPRAQHSDAVFFASRLQAAQVAVHRRATGLALDAWYWPPALPGVAVQAAPVVFLDQLVKCLCEHPAARTTLPAWVADAVARGHAGWLVPHLSAHAVQGLLGAAAVPVAAASDASGGTSTAWALPGGITVRLNTPAPRWLHAVLGAAQWRPAAARGLVAAVPVLIQAPTVEPRGSRSDSVAGSMQAASQVLTAYRPVLAAPRPKGHGAPTHIESEPAARTRAGQGALPFITELPVVPDGDAWTTVPTNAGGLLFVLPVLERLGFADWQAAHPEVPLCGAVLQHLLHRLALPPDDPAWDLVASLPVPVDGAPAPAVAHWVVAVRRHLRRHARIGLASLCLRHAHLRWSPSHLDVHFALASADLRVRRLGLDVDPGWLPWLQRVVMFHFVREGEGL